jgi:hypothetical protein
VFRVTARIVAVTGLFAALVPSPTAADTRRPAHPCAALTDPTARLACFDEAFVAPDAEVAADTTHAAAAADVQPAAEGRPEAQAGPATDEFGLNPALRRAREAANPGEGSPDRIEARVVGLQRRGTGELTIALDNGQVWIQVEVSHKRLAEGDRVLIRKAAFGSYLLVTPSRASMRVRRIE